MLLGVGLIAAAAMVGFVGSTFEFDGRPGSRWPGRSQSPRAGVLGVLTRRSPEVELHRLTGRIAAAGIAIGLSPLVVNLAEWRNSGLLEDWGGSFYIEVLAAEAAAMVALLLLIRAPRFRLHAGGALIAMGTLLALHYVGVMIQIAKYDGGGSLKPGGVLGVAGALVLLSAGVSVLRFERRDQSARLCLQRLDQFTICTRLSSTRRREFPVLDVGEGERLGVARLVDALERLDAQENLCCCR